MATYAELRNIFKEYNIYFKGDGGERHNDNDVITWNRSKTVIEPYCAFYSGNSLCSMGSFSYTFSSFPTNTKIGRYCSIAAGCRMLGLRHPFEWLTSCPFTYDNKAYFIEKFAWDNSFEHIIYKLPASNRGHGLIIENDVWIGANVTLKRDIILHTGSVVAANATVTKDVPPYAIVGGVPAKVIKYRFKEQQIAKLLELEWWKYSYKDIQKLDYRYVNEFIEKFQDLKRHLSEYKPEPLRI